MCNSLCFENVFCFFVPLRVGTVLVSRPSSRARTMQQEAFGKSSTARSYCIFCSMNIYSYSVYIQYTAEYLYIRYQVYFSLLRTTPVAARGWICRRRARASSGGFLPTGDRGRTTTSEQRSTAHITTHMGRPSRLLPGSVPPLKRDGTAMGYPRRNRRRHRSQERDRTLLRFR